MENINFTQIFTPVIVALLTAIAYIIGIAIKQLAVKASNWLQEKRQNEIFDAAYKVAQGIYIYLEDEYAEQVGQLGQKKMEQMCQMLSDKFPSLTQEELISINKQVWLSFQEGFTGAYEKSPKDGKDGVIKETTPDILLLQTTTESQRIDE